MILAVFIQKYNLIGKGILDRLSEILSHDFDISSFLIITDERIWSHVSHYFTAFMENNNTVSIEMFPSEPMAYADSESVEKLASIISSCNSIPIAVGSGTINDIVKRAAYLSNKKYICIPTAPSVDGFSSTGAAITVDGFKTTLECLPPYYIVADKNIIENAPYELISAGYGDLIGKLTAGADWIIADLLSIEKIDNIAWSLSQNAARRLFYRSNEIRSRNPDAIVELYKGLIDSGLSIQLYKNSRPASGTEHLLSHTWEMIIHNNNDRIIFHGLQIAFGTLISAAMMNEIFSENSTFAEDIKNGRLINKDLLKYSLSIVDSIPLAAAARKRIMDTATGKTPDQKILEKRVENIAINWALLSQKIRNQLPPFREILSALDTVGCPTKLIHLNMKSEDIYMAIRIASLIRNRYTMPDFVSELGILDLVIEALLSYNYILSILFMQDVIYGQQ